MGNNTERSGIKFSQILKILKRNIILIALVLILALGTGYGYTKIQKPSYTAREGMFFKATNIQNPIVSYNVNAMRAYIDTVLDFCDEGVVLDRAEAYYVAYSNAKAEKASLGEQYSLKQFFENNDKNDVYVIEENRVRQHYSKSAIRVSAEKTEELETSFYFTISYTDGSYEEAAEKAKILSYAFDKESAKKITEDQFMYFDGIEVEMSNAGTVGVYSNTNKTSTIFLFGLIGIAASLLIVYLRCLLDNTIKTTEDIEEITGVSNFSHIGRRKGGK